MEEAKTALTRNAPGTLLLVLGVAAGWLAAQRVGLPDHVGYLVLVVGEVALALMTFTPRQIAAGMSYALRLRLPDERVAHARRFWEAAARNAGLLGALGAHVGFVGLFATTDSIARIVSALGERVAGPWLAGLLLAALCALPTLSEPSPPAPVKEPPVAAPAGLTTTSGLGYGLLAASLVWMLLPPDARAGIGPSAWLLRGPAWLAVVGGALAFALYLGDLRRGRTVTLALVLAGLSAAILGLLQALHGFTLARIEMLAAGLTFQLSASVAMLVGLAVAVPLEARDRSLGASPSGQLVWYGVPIVTVLLLGAAITAILTPIAKPVGG